MTVNEFVKETEKSIVKDIAITGRCGYKCTICPMSSFCRNRNNDNFSKSDLASQWLRGNN